MQAFSWPSPYGNFGDDLNGWLWDFLLPGYRNVHPDMLLVGVGTVLDTEMLPNRVRKLVIGSGCGYGRKPAALPPDEWDVRCVRGPETARALGLPRELAIIDPAVMVSDMPEYRALARGPRSRRPIFVPHWESAVAGVWEDMAGVAGLDYVNPCGDPAGVIRAIAAAPLVVAESLHAAIIADCLRVPWVAVASSSRVNTFKWDDWAASVDLPYRPHRWRLWNYVASLGPKLWDVRSDNGGEPSRATAAGSTPRRSGLKRAAKMAFALPSALALRRAARAEPQLSRDGVVDAQKARLRDVLASVRADYAF